MRGLQIDFFAISRALSSSMKMLQEEGCDFSALEKLADARKSLERAITFSCSKTIY
ncbi:MAG: hypothetical protein LOD92_01475 [Bacillales bacterium]